MTVKAPSKKSYATVSVEESPDKKKTTALSSNDTTEAVITRQENMKELEVGSTWSKGVVQPPLYRDKKFAISFIVHLIFIFTVAVAFGPPAIREIAQNGNIQLNRNKRENDRILNIVVDFYNPGRSERKLQNDQLLIEDFVPTNKTLDDEALQNAIDQGAQNQYSEEGTSVSKEHTQLYTDEEVIIIEKAMYFSIFVVMASLLISTCLILVALYLLREHAQKVIKGSLFFIIGYFLLGGIVALVVPSVSLDNLDDEDLEMMKEADQDGKIMVAIFDFILALCFACYAKAIWSNIPFAAANLKTGVTACRANLGVFIFAFLAPLLNTIIYILQLLAFVAALNFAGAFEEDPSDTENVAMFIILILFSLSTYWTSEVIKNISTVIVSGVVGTWWFAPLEASSCCSSAVLDSFKRAMTHSFGSICCGSLLVAIVNLIIDSLQRARRNRSCGLLYCVITCLLECLENLMEYFNKWAFVYVGLYGYDFMTAGKNVVALFRARGWSSIISDHLINRALMMVSTFIGLGTGLLITGIWDLFELSDSKDQVVMIFSFIYFYAAFVIAVVNSNQLLSVVGAAADTAVVCFAEASAEFEENHPQLSHFMHETYAEAWPNLNFRGEVI